MLSFSSGADTMPPLGFGRLGRIEFLGQGRNLATSSTCDIILRLPTLHDTYESFKEAMILALKNNDGFGGV